MLELPTVELQQRVNEELQENPALEEGSVALENENDNANAVGDRDEYLSEDEEWVNPLKNDDFDYDDYVGDGDDYTSDYRETNYTGGQSLMEYLKSQVYLTKMTKPERHIAKWVLGNIDDEGYLRRTTEQLVDDLSFQEGLQVSDEQMEEIVRQIKQFDPAGVAAYDLRECLTNQLLQKEQTVPVKRALKVVNDCWEEFSKRHLEKVRLRLGIHKAEMEEVMEEIVHLNQKPANAFIGNVYESHKESVIPDFYVEQRDGELVLTLNTGDIPELHVSEQYKLMQREYDKDKEASRFIKQKLDDAAWFIDAIQQRNETLQRTMTAILQFQREFFEEGDDAYLKPMILQDIADMTGYDVSTISRVSNSKYVQTEYGVFPLKHFFSEGMLNTEGDEISTREIKQILSEVIGKEDRSNPLNDDQLVKVLLDHGYMIARRTVAKYRDQLGIPVARIRKGV